MRRAIACWTISAALFAGQARADDLPVPRGTRADATGVLISGAGFGATVEQIGKQLARRGLAYHAVGPYRAHGVDVVRYLPDDDRSPWLAIHVFRAQGKTSISFLKRAP